MSEVFDDEVSVCVKVELLFRIKVVKGTSEIVESLGVSENVCVVACAMVPLPTTFSIVACQFYPFLMRLAVFRVGQIDGGRRHGEGQREGRREGRRE